jgi:hypothetical protein
MMARSNHVDAANRAFAVCDEALSERLNCPLTDDFLSWADRPMAPTPPKGPVEVRILDFTAQ